MTVVDVSDHGALLEGGARLLPGTHVDVHIVTRHGRVLVRSRIVRAFVSHVQRDAVRYRGALAFECRVDTSRHEYSVPTPIGGFTETSGIDYPAVAGAQEGRVDETL
jgi:hypothetical protein